MYARVTTGLLPWGDGGLYDRICSPPHRFLRTVHLAPIARDTLNHIHRLGYVSGAPCFAPPGGQLTLRCVYCGRWVMCCRFRDAALCLPQDGVRLLYKYLRTLYTHTERSLYTGLPLVSLSGCLLPDVRVSNTSRLRILVRRRPLSTVSLPVPFAFPVRHTTCWTYVGSVLFFASHQHT